MVGRPVGHALGARRRGRTLRRREVPAPGKIFRRDVPRRTRLVRVLGIGTRLTSSEAPSEAADLRSDERTAAAPATAPVELDFDAFFRSQYPSVVRLSYSLCGSMSIAEELAQEAFITAHRKWVRLASFDRPDLWIRRVVINRSISHRRRQASEQRAFQRLRGRPREVVEAELGDEAVWQALRELSPRQAQVLALFYVEDQPLSAVAEILELGEETVKTHLKRGRAAMAAKLGEPPAGDDVSPGDAASEVRS